MSLGRLIPVVSAVVMAGGVALAQPKAPAPAPAGGAPAPAPADGSGSAVAPIEDAPPSDMEGTTEDPDAPRGTGEETSVTTTAPTTRKKSGYPIEESQRPITLPQNMSEISIAPHFMASPYIGGDALRARYGITPQVQLGLSYVFAGVYDDPSTVAEKTAFHVGKTGGVDVTVLLTKWLGVKVGVPVYFDPVAVSVTAGAPMKFVFDKFAIGGFDDVLNIRITKFAPRYDYEYFNHVAAYGVSDGRNTEQSRGFLRFSGFGVYQQKPNLALIGRIGVDASLGAGGGGGGGGGTASVNETTTFVKAGVQLSPKKFVDVGLMAGFEDLSRAGSFGLTGILAVRI